MKISNQCESYFVCINENEWIIVSVFICDTNNLFRAKTNTWLHPAEVPGFVQL